MGGGNDLLCGYKGDTGRVAASIKVIGLFLTVVGRLLLVGILVSIIDLKAMVSRVRGAAQPTLSVKLFEMYLCASLSPYPFAVADGVD